MPEHGCGVVALVDVKLKRAGEQSNPAGGVSEKACDPLNWYAVRPVAERKVGAARQS